MQSRINALFFDPRKFTVEEAKEWARKHSLPCNDVSKHPKRIVVHCGEMRDEHEYRETMLDDGVRARVEIVGGGAPVVGRADQRYYVPPAGASPGHNVAPLPDFNAIFNHRADDPEQQEREAEQRSVRRRQLASHAKEKFGFLGVAAPEPVLAYEPEHYPLIVRGSSGQERDSENPNENPQPRAPRMVIGPEHRRIPQRTTANGPVQPVKQKPRKEDDR